MGFPLELSTNAAQEEFPQLASRLAQIGREFYARGWALGTSGNFSARVSSNPLRLAITATGIDKGGLQASDVLQVDFRGNPLGGPGRSSAETALHLAIVRARDAGSVLHTHSVWGTALSAEYASKGGMAIEGYEMLKGLEGVRTHKHREWLPIIENSQQIASLAESVEQTLERHPGAHGLLLQGHGLYSWGANLEEAKRHVEVLEFLLEVVGRRRLGREPEPGITEAARHGVHRGGAEGN